MHADIAELLSVRDSTLVDARVKQHLDECPRCQGELESLRAVRDGLRALPLDETPDVTWEDVLARAQARGPLLRTERFDGWYGAAVGIAATVVMTVALLLLGQREAPVTEMLDAPAAMVNSTPQLMGRSRELEQSLRSVDMEGQIMSGRTASTIAALEERIAYIDQRLSRADQDRLSQEQRRRLWQQRVMLLDSLVRLRYAEAQRADF
jgi:hypothetical protein